MPASRRSSCRTGSESASRWSIEEGIRRLTSDTADLFGIDGRGRLQPGSFADVNVIDFEGLRLPPPTYANDFPNGAGRYVQGAEGYDCTIVNGQVFMEHGQHTGAFAGRLLKNRAASLTSPSQLCRSEPAQPVVNDEVAAGPTAHRNFVAPNGLSRSSSTKLQGAL